MARGAASKLSPYRIEAARKQAKALELKAEGWSLKDIAIQCGYASPSGAAMAISRGLEKMVKIPAAGLRQIINEQLDEAILAVMPQVRDGDLKAVEMLVKIGDRRAKLYGLDGGEQVDPPDTAGKKRKKESYNDDQAASIIKLLAETGALNALIPEGMPGGVFFLEDGSLAGDDSDIPISEADEEAEIEALAREFRQGATVMANGDLLIPPGGREW